MIPIKEYIPTTVAAAQAGECNGVDCSGLYHDVSSINTYSNKPIHTNIIKAEHLALENLRKDKDCIIDMADKGVALVVMDKTAYITNCEGLLQKTQFTNISPKTYLQTIHKELIAILQDYKRNNFISETEYTLLRCHGSPTARFYGLPKIHNQNMPMHPVVSACGTATYNNTTFIPKFCKITVARFNPLLKIV